MVDNRLREVFRYANAHLFAKKVLCISNDGRKNLFTQQYDTDNGKDMCRLAPHKGVGSDKRIDGIYRLVEHHRIDLCNERPYKGKHKC